MRTVFTFAAAMAAALAVTVFASHSYPWDSKHINPNFAYTTQKNLATRQINRMESYNSSEGCYYELQFDDSECVEGDCCFPTPRVDCGESACGSKMPVGFCNKDNVGQNYDVLVYQTPARRMLGQVDSEWFLSDGDVFYRCGGLGQSCDDVCTNSKFDGPCLNNGDAECIGKTCEFFGSVGDYDVSVFADAIERGAVFLTSNPHAPYTTREGRSYFPNPDMQTVDVYDGDVIRDHCRAMVDGYRLCQCRQFPTPSASPSTSSTPTPSPSPTSTPTPSPSPSSSPTPSNTVSASPTPSHSPTPSPTSSPSASSSATPTVTASASPRYCSNTYQVLQNDSPLDVTYDETSYKLALGTAGQSCRLACSSLTGGTFGCVFDSAAFSDFSYVADTWSDDICIPNQIQVTSNKLYLPAHCDGEGVAISDETDFVDCDSTPPQDCYRLCLCAPNAQQASTCAPYPRRCLDLCTAALAGAA